MCSYSLGGRHLTHLDNICSAVICELLVASGRVSGQNSCGAVEEARRT